MKPTVQQEYRPSPAATRSALLYPIVEHPTGTLLLSDERNDRPIDPWFSFDKVQHFTFSFLFTVGWQYGLESKLDWTRIDSLPLSMGATAMIGLSKELYDWQFGPRRFFSYRDLVANGAGIAFAAAFILL